MIDLVCACATARRTARLITQLYATEMGSLLEPTQFAILLVFEQKPGATQAAVSEILALDKTTVSRNLAVLKRNGWLESDPASLPGKDARTRTFRLSPAGQAQLAAAKPAWRKAQSRLRAALGTSEWQQLFHSLNQAAQAAGNAPHAIVPV